MALVPQWQVQALGAEFAVLLVRRVQALPAGGGWRPARSGRPGGGEQAPPAQRPDTHGHAGLGRLDHAAVVDRHGDVVDRGGIVGVVGVEQQVPSTDLLDG
jgi:hypothetical protein